MARQSTDMWLGPTTEWAKYGKNIQLHGWQLRRAHFVGNRSRMHDACQRCALGSNSRLEIHRRGMAPSLQHGPENILFQPKHSACVVALLPILAETLRTRLTQAHPSLYAKTGTALQSTFSHLPSVFPPRGLLRRAGAFSVFLGHFYPSWIRGTQRKR